VAIGSVVVVKAPNEPSGPKSWNGPIHCSLRQWAGTVDGAAVHPDSGGYCSQDSVAQNTVAACYCSSNWIGPNSVYCSIMKHCAPRSSVAYSESEDRLTSLNTKARDA
jgi:hypothetical protein